MEQHAAVHFRVYSWYSDHTTSWGLMWYPCRHGWSCLKWLQSVKTPDHKKSKTGARKLILTISTSSFLHLHHSKLFCAHTDGRPNNLDVSWKHWKYLKQFCKLCINRVALNEVLDDEVTLNRCFDSKAFCPICDLRTPYVCYSAT